jgi:hypothetical protein
MSRTIRKRAESFITFYGWEYNQWDLENKLKKDNPYCWGRRQYVDPEWESYEVDEAKYYTDNYGRGYFRRSLPKAYRKWVNKLRRKHDKRELRKEVTFNDYDGQYNIPNGIAKMLTHGIIGN